MHFSMLNDSLDKSSIAWTCCWCGRADSTSRISINQSINQLHWCKRASWPLTLQISRQHRCTKTVLHNSLQNW